MICFIKTNKYLPIMKELEKDDIIFFLKTDKEVYLVNSTSQELEDLVYSTWDFSENNLVSSKYFYKIDRLPAKSMAKISQEVNGNSYHLEFGSEETIEQLLASKVNDLSDLRDCSPNVYFLKQELIA